MLSPEAPPGDDLDVPDLEPDELAEDVSPARRRQRRHKRRPALRLPRLSTHRAPPFGLIELGVFLLVAFVFGWTTRSWVLTALLAGAWVSALSVARALHRRHRAPIERRRFTRDRMTSGVFLAFVILAGLAGLRAWTTNHPDPIPPDPAGPYEVVSGAAKVAWQKMYDRPADVRAIDQTAPSYWELTLEDSEGCWAQVMVIVNGLPAVGGERTPSPCPIVQKAATGRGERLDPTKAAPAAVAVDFVEAWLDQGNYGINVAPGRRVAPLGRTIDVTDVTAYALNGDATNALLWVEATAADGPLGMRVALINDQGRWFVTGVRGGPSVTSTLSPLPDPTTTTTAPTTTSTAPAK